MGDGVAAFGGLPPQKFLKNDKIKKGGKVSGQGPTTATPTPAFLGTKTPLKKKTLGDKRQRISGKSGKKPYITSSLGDMARHMIRMACTENTLNMTEPPPVEFYNFWYKFSISEDKLPVQFIDTRKVSTAKIKMNTSSFDFFAKNMSAINSTENLKLAKPKQDEMHDLSPALSALWKNVRRSMSTESFISSSTKISERQENVLMESGWSDGGDPEALSESDDDLLRPGVSYESSTAGNQTEIRKIGLVDGRKTGQVDGRKTGQVDGRKTGQVDGRRTKTDDAKRTMKGGSSVSVLSAKSKQGNLMNKEIGAVAASVLQMQLEEQRVAMEGSLKHKDREIIDHFMDDLDDSFLIDALSYGLLPDNAFNTDFDYFNEDPIYRARELERLEAEATALAQLGKEGAAGEATKDKFGRNRLKGEGTISEMSLDVEVTDDEDNENEGEEEGEEEEEEEEDIKGLEDQEVSKGRNKGDFEDYETCIRKQKRRIEQRLRAAVRKRSAMGSYKVPKGGLPLARTFGYTGPGPAEYYPNIEAVKPRTTGVFLSKRWTRNIYDTPGPGPAGHVPSCKECSLEMKVLHQTPRFPNVETVGPGPGKYNTAEYGGTAQDSPHALVLSRPLMQNVGCGGSKYTNLFGLSRFGRHNPPRALIISKHPLKDKSEPGPGAYNPAAVKDTKVGITLKDRFPGGFEDDEDAPPYVDLPSFLGQGPAFTFGIKKYKNQYNDSPGPIYDPVPNKLKGLSMTFRPFLRSDIADEPSPLEYGTKPGNESLKFEYPRAPQPIIHGSHNLNYGIDKLPGPNQYDVKDWCRCPKGITMKGRYESTTEILPGPADYFVRNGHFPLPPRAIFQHKHKEKPPKEKSPGFVYDPKDPRDQRIIGGLMAPRWGTKQTENDPNPGFTDLTGFTNRGKYSKIPISLKSRHTPFKFSHIGNKTEVLDKGNCGMERIRFKVNEDKPDC